MNKYRRFSTSARNRKVKRKIHILAAAKLLLIIAACSFPATVHAQTDTLGNEQINVIKAYEPTLSDAYKISEVPDKDTLTPSTPAFDYSVSPKRLGSSFEVSQIKPVKQKDELLPEEQRNYVKGGFGNYLTTYAEGFFKLNKNKSHITAIHIQHLSSQGNLAHEAFPGLSSNGVDFISTRFMKKSVLHSKFSLSREVYHFYGGEGDSVTPSRKELMQRFYKYGEDIRWSSVNPDAGALQYDIRTTYNSLYELPYLYLGKTISLKEGNFVAEATASLPIGKLIYGITSKVDYNHGNNQNSKYSQAILILDPKVTKQGKFWRLTTGTNLVFQPNKFDSTKTKWNPAIFSDIDFALNFMDNAFVLFGGIGGGVIKNNFMSLSEENPYLSSLSPLLYSYNLLDLKLGARGAASKYTSWMAFADFSKIDNMPFFVTDWNPYFTDKTFLSKFNVIYDDGVEVLNLHGEMTNKTSKKLTLFLKGDYFHYATNFDHPWQKPSVEALVSAKYEIGTLKTIKPLEKGKWFVRGDGYFEGTRFAQLVTLDAAGTHSFSSVKLKAFVDVSAALEYQHTERLSFFLKLNNMASVRYQRWLNYPSQRINLMAGLSYVF